MPIDGIGTGEIDESGDTQMKQSGSKGKTFCCDLGCHDSVSDPSAERVDPESVQQEGVRSSASMGLCNVQGSRRTHRRRAV